MCSHNSGGTPSKYCSLLMWTRWWPASYLGWPFFDAVVAADGEGGPQAAHTLQIRVLQQVPGDELAAQRAQLPEERHAGRKRQAREVDSEELGVALAVEGAVEDGVDVVEDVLGREAVGLASGFRDEAQTELRLAVAQEGGRQVGRARGRLQRRQRLSVQLNLAIEVEGK